MGKFMKGLTVCEGSLSQIGGLGVIADDKAYREQVMGLYGVT